MPMDKIAKALSLFVILLFVIISGTIAFFQTDFGKEKVKSFLSSQDIFTYESLEGFFPFEMTFNKVKLHLDGKVVSINSIKIRPSLISFLKQQIHFHYLKASKINIEEGPSMQGEPQSPFSLPYTFKVSQYVIEDFTIKKDVIVDMEGKLKLIKDLSSYHFTQSITRQGFKDSSFQLDLHKRRLQYPKIKLDATIKSTEILKPFVEFEQDIAGKISIRGKGKKGFLGDLMNLKIPEIKAKGKGNVTKVSGLERLFTKPWVFSFELNTPYLSFSNFSIRAKDFAINSTFSVNEDHTIENAPISYYIQTLSGSFSGDGTFSYKDDLSADLMVQSQSFHIDREEFEDLQAHVLFNSKNLSLSFEGSTYFNDTRYEYLGNATYKNTLFTFSDLSLTSPYLDAQGQLYLNRNFDLIGKINGSFSSINLLKRYLPDFSSIGAGTFNAELLPEQKIDFNLEINSFFYHYFGIEKLSAKATFLDFDFNKYQNIDLKITNAEYQDLKIDSLSLHTSTVDENWPLDLSIKGSLMNPFEINAIGFWRYLDEELSLNIQDLSGFLLNHPFISQEPIQLEWTPDRLFLTTLQLDLIDSSFLASANMEKDKGTLEIDIENFPVEFLLLFSPYYYLTGNFSMHAFFVNDEKLSGTIKTSFEDLTLPSAPSGVISQGVVSANYENDLLDIEANFTLGELPYLNSKMHLPITIDPISLLAKIHKEEDLSGNIDFSGNIEDLFDLFDFGPHTITGKLSSDFSITGSYNSPQVLGKATFKEGFYENAYSGTKLRNISAEIVANRDKLSLQTLNAEGMTGGTLTSFGSLELDPDQNFPFLFQLECENLTSVEIGFLDAKGDGKLTIEGDKDSAIATGKVSIKDANIQIPDSFGSSVPDLEVHYIHAPPSFTEIKKPILPQTQYPFTLDISVDAPKNVTITGRGVTSEWGGSFSIGGTVHQPIAFGNIDLIRGVYRFSGKTFNLTEGRLTFPEQPTATPTLLLEGRIVEKGTTILVNLSGPLYQPKLNFSSIPPLSTSSILSLLLFGQEINDISGPQAIQLATLVASLASNSPDILETTRKSLGIDRLTLVSVPTKDELDALSIQVGKYIAQGVLVTITQGVGTDQSNAGVEVELSHGFFFQADTQQQLEQGKFTLKWNMTY